MQNVQINVTVNVYHHQQETRFQQPTQEEPTYITTEEELA